MSIKVYTKKARQTTQKVVRLFLLPVAIPLFMLGWVLYRLSGKPKKEELVKIQVIKVIEDNQEVFDRLAKA